MGSAASILPMVDRNIVERGPTLNAQTSLCHPISVDEIKTALFSMDTLKAPGIDGYNALFFQKAWSIIGSSITVAVQDFFTHLQLPQQVNCTYVTLIPKIPNASYVKEFRPIACCTVLYKNISKVITNRLQNILPDIVGESQSAFVKGRVIFDNIILSHEIVKGYNRKNISPRCMLKIDLQKAYDSVEWPFIEHLMLALGFPNQFVKWIMVCLNTVSYSFNINGELTKPFKARKGLRQGDPLSPYLFVLCMEYLDRCLKGLRDRPQFSFHLRCKKLNLTHVCFADDLLLFARGDVHSVRELYTAFQIFSNSSGLRANVNKSSIYFGGVRPEVQEEILEEFQFTKGFLPFKYLGVPLSTKKLTILQCQPLILNILHKIERWSASYSVMQVEFNSLNQFSLGYNCIGVRSF